MKRLETARVLNAALLGVATMLALPATAAVPSGKAILRRFAEAQSSLHAARSSIIGTATIPGAGEVSVRIDLGRDRARGCTLQTNDGRGVTTYAISPGTNKVSVSPGAGNPALEAFVALACPLLALTDMSAESTESAALSLASTMGVNTSVSSLSEMDDRVGFVVGAPPGQTNRAQLWFDTRTDRPLRIIAHQGGAAWDIHLIDTASIATNRLMPRLVIVSQNGSPALEMHLMAQSPRLSGREVSAEAAEEDEGD